ncbi:MAG: hypothetical protein OHK0013_42910 [Sandaracinaceae bacterium]
MATTFPSRSIAALSLAALSLAALVCAPRADAQEAVSEVRELERCIAEHQTHLTRIVRLIGEAEARTSSSDAAVARDARDAITTLVHRAHEVRGHLERCVREARIPSAHDDAEVTTVSEPPEGRDATIAQAGGTVQAVHPAEPIGQHVRVVTGERVDGRGTVPVEDLRRSVRAFVGPGIDRCYAAYLDRASARRGEIEVSFTAADGAVREVAVERLGPFDAAFRNCVVQAVTSMQLHHTSGRTVFSYVLAVGG